MLRNRTLHVLMALVALMAVPAVAQVTEDADSALFEFDGTTPEPVWNGPMGTVLVDNGPLVNSPGTGAGGADESVLQSVSLGMNILGFGHQTPLGIRIADDFEITDPLGWQIDTCTFFGYQTGAPATGTIAGVTLQIWDAAPPGGSVVFGDPATNRMSSTGFSNIYRVSETTGGATNRAIQANVVDVGVVLGPGTYWLDWSSDGSASFSGPWAPPVTINGVTTTGDGLQTVDGGVTYLPADDSGTLTQQGFPFICEGTVIEEPAVPVVEIPTLGAVGLGLLLLALGAAGIVRMRRRR